MSKRYLFVLSALLLTLSSAAQIFPGYRTSNYTGVNGVFFNPANIADNRYKWDVNLLSANAFVGNDQTGQKFSEITKSFHTDSLKSKLLRGNGKVNSLIYLDLTGPSFMIGLGRNTAIAVTSRSRVFANGKDVNGNLALATIDAGHSNVATPYNFNSNQSMIHAMGWTELGVSLGQVFTAEKSRHFFKGGLTLKYLGGTADSYLRMKDITGTIGYTGGTNYITGPASGAILLNSTGTDNFSDYHIGDLLKFRGSGIGGDIGFVYEWRPPANYSMYETDRFANKYKIRVGVALLDVGMIKFNKPGNIATYYQVDIPAPDQYDLNRFSGKSIGDFKAVLDASPGYFISGQPKTSSYSVNLPTTVQADFDWLPGAGIGLNLAARINVYHSGYFRLYDFNAYSFTPRWENRIFSVELPLNYNDLTQFNAGLGFRIGPLFFGSGSILSALVHESKQADAYVGLHFGIPYKKKVKPDIDLDGVYDNVDKCPNVAGLPRYQGCPIPDTDGDGINDEEDSCVSVAGLPRFHGCPIPDSDKDGINDEEDSCVDVAGLPQFHGCPDTDGDGIPDPEDKCPNVAGPLKYQGCPVKDSDGDGLNDDEDLCPNQPGPVITRGCPVNLPPEEVAVKITADFRSILFDFGKSTIRPESEPVIIKAAKTMNEEVPDAKFYIDGYTDNIGSAVRNKEISKARALAVVNALIKAGVDKTRLTARGFGKDRPKCDNTTESGRQCNRRVEVVNRSK
jgi:outer membrane protein OmpA-like peptidoglycan-associated protein